LIGCQGPDAVTHPNPADHLILALDGLEAGQALALVDSLPGLRWVKVGLELFTAAGPAVA